MTRDVVFAREGVHNPQDSALAEYQRIRAAELRTVVAALPLFPGDRVLDTTCGEGRYTVLLAERIAPGGAVVGFDSATASLAQARVHANASGWGKLISFKQGDATTLPFENNSFDLVWCDWARLASDEGEAIVGEFRRVVRPGGHVALFANTMLHLIALAWPADLEPVVREAQLQALNHTVPVNSFTIGRDLGALLDDAKFGESAVTSYTTIHHMPFDIAERSYLAAYLETLREQLRPFIPAEHLAWFEQLCTPQSASYLLDQPDFSVTYSDLLVCARKG